MNENLFEVLRAFRLNTAPYPDAGMWPQSWDMYWWVDWMAYAPLLGLFMVRCANGRTLREFVLIEWLLPALFGIVWFTVFGGTILHAQLWEGSMDFLNIYNTQGAEALTLALFDVLPLSTIAKIVMLVIITISLVTQCDSMAVTLAGMCMDDSNENTEAPIWMKLFWGTVFAVVAAVFVVLAQSCARLAPWKRWLYAASVGLVAGAVVSAWWAVGALSASKALDARAASSLEFVVQGDPSINDDVYSYTCEARADGKNLATVRLSCDRELKVGAQVRGAAAHGAVHGVGHGVGGERAWLGRGHVLVFHVVPFLLMRTPIVRHAAARCGNSTQSGERADFSRDRVL